MSWDLSYLWDIIQTVWDRIANWFNQLWGYINQIANTGQGIFFGLVSAASTIWDAIIKFANTLRTAFQNFAIFFGSWFYDAFKKLGEWLWLGIGNIGSALYSAIQWLYNGILWLGSQVSTALQSLYNWFISALAYVIDSVNDWWEGFRTSINNWWINLLRGIRQKLIDTIKADVILFFTWRSFEKASELKSITDFVRPFGTLVMSAVFGEILASTLDAIVPMPSTSTFELIPSMTLPSVVAPELRIPTAPIPTAPTPPPKPAVGYGLPYDIELKLIELTYDTTTVSRDFDIGTPAISYDTTTSTTDGSLSLPDLAYETAVA